MKSKASHSFSPWVTICTLVFAFLLAGFAYLTFLQTPFLGRRELLIFLILFLAFIPVIYLLLTRFLIPRFQAFSRRGRFTWLLISGLMGVFALITSVQPHYFYLFLPQRNLTIEVPVAQSEREITLQWFTTALGDVSFDHLQVEGNWQRTESGLTYSGTQPASLTWQGKTGNSAELVFSKTDQSVPIKVGWEGQFQTIDLDNSDSTAVSVPQDLSTGSPRTAVYPLPYLVRGIISLFAHYAFPQFGSTADRSGRETQKSSLAALFPTHDWGLGCLFTDLFPGNRYPRWN